MRKVDRQGKKWWGNGSKILVKEHIRKEFGGGYEKVRTPWGEWEHNRGERRGKWGDLQDKAASKLVEESVGREHTENLKDGGVSSNVRGRQCESGSLWR